MKTDEEVANDLREYAALCALSANLLASKGWLVFISFQDEYGNDIGSNPKRQARVSIFKQLEIKL